MHVAAEMLARTQNMTKIMQAIDWWSEYSGRYVSWIALGLTFFMGFNVLSRYAFDKPINGEFDLSLYFYCFHFLLGGTWVLLHRANVRVDIICNRWPPRARAVLELVFYIVFFFWYVGTVMIFSWFNLASSCSSWELSHQTPLMPPLCPMRIMIFVAFTGLFLEGIMEFIRYVGYLRKGEIPS